MGILSILLISQLTLDIARFKANTNSNLCELYISLPYSELYYTKVVSTTGEGNLLKANFKMKLIITGAQEFTEEFNKISYINSYEEAKTRNLHILDKIDIVLDPGKYTVKIEIASDSSTKAMQKVVSTTCPVEVLPPPAELYISDIELATKIEPSDTAGKFIKNGLLIIPNPQCTFSTRYTTLYAYSEIYNLTAGNEYEVNYTILNEKGEAMEKLTPKTLTATAEDVTEVIDMDVASIEQGTYILKIEVTQAESTATKEKSFQVIKEAEEMVSTTGLELTQEELKYYYLIKYVASPKELELYNTLPEEAKATFLINFWEKRGKELLHLLIDRVKYADDNFSTTGELGRDSDMGRIWIKYGKPDEIEQYPHEAIYYPCEKWIYFGAGGMTFIFVDKSSYGRYELVYSSIPKESTDPNYRKWVNPEVLQ